MVGAMAGLILVVLAVARLGRLVRYLPMPVVEGFTAGIAVVIALQQVPAALGVTGAQGDKVWQQAVDALRDLRRRAVRGVDRDRARRRGDHARRRARAPRRCRSRCWPSRWRRSSRRSCRSARTCSARSPAVCRRRRSAFLDPATFSAMLPSALASRRSRRWRACSPRPSPTG